SFVTRYASRGAPHALYRLQDRDRDVGACPSMTMDEAAPRVLELKGGIPQVLAYGPLQLPEGKDRLHQARGTNRMPAGQESPRWIDRQASLLGQAHAIVNPRHKGGAALHECSTFTVLTQTEVFIGLDLRRGVGIV